MKYSRLTLAMLYLYFVPFALDFASTVYFMVSHGHGLMETNPLFVYFGYWAVVWMIIHTGLIYWLITVYSPKSPDRNWLVLSMVCWLLLARALAIYGNFQAAQTPISYEAASIITASEKVNYYSMFVSLIVFLPILIQQLTYSLFKLDYHILKKN